MASYRIGIDIGGTFTDLIVVDTETGEFFIGKVLGTTAISLLLILVTELLFFRKQKFRTNTA